MHNETNKPEKTLGALILAAGLSSRMKTFKPLIQLNGKTLLEHAIGLFEAEGITPIVTVTGHRAEDLFPIVRATSSAIVVNEQYQDGMFSSVQKGVEKLREACDAFFLLPADIPFVLSQTVRKLREAYFRDSSRLVYYPQSQARRGHPPLIDVRLANDILSYDGEAGLRGLLHHFQDQTVDVAVNDPFIHLDIDTPEDLIFVRNALTNPP